MTLCFAGYPVISRRNGWQGDLLCRNHLWIYTEQRVYREISYPLSACLSTIVIFFPKPGRASGCLPAALSNLKAHAFLWIHSLVENYREFFLFLSGKFCPKGKHLIRESIKEFRSMNVPRLGYYPYVLISIVSGLRLRNNPKDRKKGIMERFWSESKKCLK